MDNIKMESYEIVKLKKAIKSGDSDYISYFWRQLKKNHTPIIEKIEGNKDEVLVTFLYKGNKDVKNVVVLSAVFWFDYKKGLMEKIPNSNIWYRTFKLKNNLRFDYTLGVNHPLSNDNIEEIQKSIKEDPYANRYVLIPKDKDDVKSEEITRNLVELPNAQPKKWTIAKTEVPKGKIKMIRFKSEILDDEYRVWIYTPAKYSEENIPCKALVLSDGYEYIKALSTPTLLDNLIHEKKIPPMMGIFIESKDNRGKILGCNEKYNSFVVDEIMPWVREKYNVSCASKDNIIAGLSLGGLSAAYLGINHSNIFGNVLSQSGAFEWCPEGCNKDEYDEEVWLAQIVKSKEKLDLKFYLEVGEIEDCVWVNMNKVNENMRDILISKGYDVKYSTFPGGHDYLSWGETLAKGLIYLTENK